MEQGADLITILDLNTEVLGNILDVVGLLLTMVTAYATGLYLFVAQAGFVFRFLALVVLTASFIFIGSFAFSYNLILFALRRCTDAACQHPDLIYEYEIAGYTFTTADFSNAAALTGVALAVLVYIVLASMTVFSGWRER
ncbi:MAG: hypothetical protein AAF788_02540 [Pseudomonadota bacterium]